jgi:hypothetical protein
VMKDFQNADDSVKMQYLDTNKNGTIEPEEAANVKVSDRNIMNNPIMKFAQDKYLPNVYRQDVDTREKRTPTSAGGSGAGVLGKMQPLMERDNIPLGSSIYPQYYGALTSSKKIDIPMKGGRVLMPTENGKGGDYELPRDKSVQGLDFVAVAKNANGKIELIFRLPTANWSQIEEDAGTNLAFPLEENPEFMDVPLKDASGKQFTARSLMGSTGTAKKKAY